MFRKIADVKRERELAETRKNEGFEQISSDHPVRKLISKFRKISHENRTTTSSNPAPSAAVTAVMAALSQQQLPLLPSIPLTTVQPASAEPMDSSPTSSTPPSASSSLQLLQLPASSTGRQREKLDTISERIETQESQVSQIASVNQSPPLQRPPKSSKWKWLKTGSAEPDSDTSPQLAPSTLKAPPAQPQAANPFDPNLSDEDTHSKASNSSERRVSIPLSLFIPKSARQATSARVLDGDTDEHVSHLSSQHIHSVVLTDEVRYRASTGKERDRCWQSKKCSARIRQASLLFECISFINHIEFYLHFRSASMNLIRTSMQRLVLIAAFHRSLANTSFCRR